MDTSEEKCSDQSYWTNVLAVYNLRPNQLNLQPNQLLVEKADQYLKETWLKQSDE